MEIVNGTRYLLEGQLSDDKFGRRYLLAVAKATFKFPEDGGGDATPRLADLQQPIFSSDLFEGEPGLSTPYFEADAAYYKPRCDIVVKAAAYPPNGRAVPELDVGFRVGECEKWAHVVGERHWQRGFLGLAPSAPEPFLRMPITYSRAYGGTRIEKGQHRVYAANPLGCGYATAAGGTDLADHPVPNLEARGAPITDPHRAHAAVSFGPIGRSWDARIGFAGTYDQHWIDEVFPLLPADFDEQYFQCVPADQQIAHPRGGEQVLLYQMHPRRPRIAFRLPRLHLPMVVLDRDRRVHRLQPLPDTLNFDVDAETFSVTWRVRHPIRRSLDEVHTLAAGLLCKRWWKARVTGTADCGCGGKETDDEDLAPVTEALDA
ncbi:MAG TPA: DUF2169 domain-containing protein [Pseudoxanthomonas sp.]|nr:DUF2169 domain-containing protein [Pseudoxanthomonas sp.]